MAKSTLFKGEVGLGYGEGEKCFQDAQKSNFTAECPNTFVAHCGSDLPQSQQLGYKLYFKHSPGLFSLIYTFFGRKSAWV